MRWIDNGQGMLRKNLSGDAAFYSFVPTPLENVVPLTIDDETVRLVAACSRKIGELEGMVRFVPNAQMYLTMYVRKEALLSAQIEGTQCTFDDILDPDNIPALQKDIADVVNYVAAVEYAVQCLDDLPLCMRLLKEVHAKLLTNVRGGEKSPGEVRTSQNWIGPAGSGLKDAAYVPPNPDDMHDALHKLEMFINGEHAVDPIVKAALVHYQFETIHPFLDGNGRLGRLLITLSLMNDGVLAKPLFYPSYQLKLRRSEYYEHLMAVRERGLYAEWVKFFCTCLLAAAEDAVEALDDLVRLHVHNVGLINGQMGRSSANGQRLLALLEKNPILDVGFVSSQLDVSRTTAANLIREFERLGIVVQRAEEKQRYRMYLYEGYLAILRQGGDPL